MPEITRPTGPDWVACIPVGSHEQHGPHLPFDTDTIIAVSLATLAAATARVPVWIGPVVAVSASAEHDGFAGTVSLSDDTTVDVLVQTATSLVANAPTCRGVVFANAHGGNVSVLRRTLSVLAGRGLPATAWSPTVAGGDAHAGCTETSVMLHLRRDLVRMDLAEPGNLAPLAELYDTMRRGGVRAVSPNGVLGDPTRASADEGARIVGQWVASLSEMLERVPVGATPAAHDE